MFQSSSEQSANHLAEIYKEILLQRDDCLRTLRVFLREIVRMLRFDINIAQFCKVFLSKGCEIFKQFEQSEFRDRIFNSMVDLVCLCMLLNVSPAVRDANLNLRTNRDQKHSPILLKFYAQMSQVQLDAMTWMHEIVPNLFKPQMSEYTAAMRKLLLLENSEQYSRSDAWPSDPERATLLRMISETPIHEDALLRIILIGITKEIPYKMQDTLELIMSVIKRASTLRLLNYPAIQVNKFDIIDFLFSLSEYHHPETIKLPDNYDPPKLAITVNYWMAWMIMLMISAHNPSTFGAFKQLMASYLRVKVDPVLYLSLIYIAKMRPAFFCNDIVTSALLTSLRRDTNVKSRQTVYSHIICSNLLARGYYDRQHWPEIFLRTYIDDAIMERMWVDAELCSPFVQNICAAFRTFNNVVNT